MTGNKRGKTAEEEKEGKNYAWEDFEGDVHLIVM